VSYTFTRTISVMSSRFICIELSFTNFSDQPVNNLHIGNKVGLRLPYVLQSITGLNSILHCVIIV